MSNTIYIGAKGVRVKIGIQSENDLSGGTATWVVTDPSGTPHNLGATLGTTSMISKSGTPYAANRWVYYDLTGTEFTVPGRWSGRVNVTKNSGASLFIGDPFEFVVVTP